MQHLPNLSTLSLTRKDELLVQLWEMVQTLRTQLSEQQLQVTELQLRITELQARLNLNSQNSSKPPSSDGLNKPKAKIAAQGRPAPGRRANWSQGRYLAPSSRPR